MQLNELSKLNQPSVKSCPTFSERILPGHLSLALSLAGQGQPVRSHTREANAIESMLTEHSSFKSSVSSSTNGSVKTLFHLLSASQATDLHWIPVTGISQQ